MRQYTKKNRGGPQSCIRLSSNCNLTEMILNHSQKLRAWYKYGDFPFFLWWYWKYLSGLIDVITKNSRFSVGGWEKTQVRSNYKQFSPYATAIPPLRASPSTPTGHYRLWQGIPESNLELNRLLNTRTLLIQRENEQKAPAIHFSPTPFLLPWDCSGERVFFFFFQSGSCLHHRRFSGGPDRMEGSPLM